MSLTPCVGCGWCCLSDQCPTSHRKHGFLPRCPELLWDEEARRYTCVLMADPEHGAEYRYEIGEGEGCCAPLNSFRNEVRNRDRG
ncbi:MAG: hypothetical protein D6E12_16540 [Desulfovibrio sp.]|nr:MAG: hypothetical protein D6E12_16540 [Desulfovibrio sp.]